MLVALSRFIYFTFLTFLSLHGICFLCNGWRFSFDCLPGLQVLRNLQAAAKLTFSKWRKSAGCIKYISSGGL